VLSVSADIAVETVSGFPSDVAPSRSWRRLGRVVTLVVPAYGVGESVSTVVRDVAVAGYALRTRGYELDLVIVADSASGAVAGRAAAEYGLEFTSHRADSLGQAYVVGLEVVLARRRSDLVATLDATGHHDATQLPRLVDRLLSGGLDVVIGSRWARQSSTPGLTWRRWLLGRLANRAFRTATGIKGTTDVTTSFRVMRTRVLRRLDVSCLPADPRGLQMAVLTHAVAQGCRVGEAAIIYQAPTGTVGPVGARDLRAFAGALLPLRRQARALRRYRLSPAGRQFRSDDFGAAADLERLGSADRFFGWTLEEFRPYLRGRVLEVGAGLGTITRKLVAADPELSVVALEPAENLFDELAALAALTPRVEASRQQSGDYVERDGRPFDTVVYLNVLEHIQDDVAELRVAVRALRPGGHVLVFGPALQWLYSELDHNAGHYRRYTVAGLRSVAEEAGLEVLSVTYFDVLGVLPYFLVYRMAHREAISGSTMWAYDRVLVPASRAVQRLLRRPPLGKNVIMVARRPA